MQKAVQQIMLGTVCRNEKETLQTLQQIRAAGYDSLELNGFMIRPTGFLVRMLTKAAGMPVGKGGAFDWKELLEEAGLGVCSLHEDLGTISRDPESVIRTAERFGTDQVVITGMYRFDYSDPQAVKKLVADLNEQGRILAEGGVKLLYHNHNCEFRRLGGGEEMAYDYLIRETDPAYVNFELDSYWPAEAGVDPLLLMDKLGDRMKLYHINDRGTRITGPSMTPILKSDSMELGCGNMNLPALLAKAQQAKVQVVILETHRNWIDKSPIKSLTISGKYLQQHLDPV